MLMLSCTITGLHIKNPLILASGIMGSSASALLRMARAGAGAVVTKSLGLTPREGYPNPTVIEVEGGLLNAMGLPNPSADTFARDVEEVKSRGVVVIASIFGSTPEEFASITERLDPHAFELNLSCPHAKGYGADIGADPDAVRDVVSAVKAVARIPVWVKLTPNVSSIAEVGLAAQEGGADAVVAINTLRAMAIDIHSGYPILGHRFGGLSGAAIRPVGVRCVYELYEAVDIPVIGVGGVGTWQDVVEYMMAGACAVQIGSAVSEDVEVFSHIASGLEAYLLESKQELKELIGLAHRV